MVDYGKIGGFFYEAKCCPSFVVDQVVEGRELRE